jgi:hypothetical protein
VIPVDSRGPTKMATDQKEKEKGMNYSDKLPHFLRFSVNFT